MANVNISKKLKAARIAAGLKQRDVYEWLGVGQSTFSAWETGASEPSVRIFLKLCQKYGIRDIYTYFAFDAPPQNTYSDIPKSFIQRYSSLPPRGKAAVENCLNFEYKMSKQARPRLHLRDITVYTRTATADNGYYPNDQNAEIIRVEAPDAASFALRVSGDSMEPLICDGDMVFVQRQKELRSGEIGIFFCNGKSYCKMWNFKNGIPQLLSLNHTYAPITIHPTDQFEISGKVLL